MEQQARTIGANDAPNAHEHRAGIHAPPIANNNFAIKPSLINMVQSNKFHGLPMEDPLDHLDNFDMLCSTVKINGVTEDAFKLRLFPFSLGNNAYTWQKTLPRASIETWEACKKAFLSKFFSTTRTVRLRYEISGFMQKGTESFGEAWERFKSYTIQCPHHGFSNESLLSTLYRGLLPKYRMMLDTASHGNFFGQTESDGMLLVENLAQSDSNYGEDYDRTVQDSGRDDGYKKSLKSLEDKLDKFILSQQGVVNYVGDLEQHQQAQDTTSSSSSKDDHTHQLLKQLLEGQDKHGITLSLMKKELHAKVDGIYNELNAKFDGVYAHLKVLDNQVAQLAYSSKKPMGQLPGISNSNHQEYVNAISLRINHEFPSHILIEDNEKQVEGVVIPIKDEANSKKDIVEVKEEKERVEASKRKTTNVEKDSISKASTFEPPPYEPKLPFPGRFKKQLMEKYRAQFEEQMKEVKKEMPKIEEFLANPQNSKFLKDAIKKKLKTLEEIVKLTHELDEENEDSKEAIPKKLEDPGSFTLPCTLGPLKFDKSLCDLGASVSLMPLSIANKLGHTSFKPCGISLVLADRSIKTPVGLLEDIPVKIGDAKIPTDFVVIEMKEEPKDPLILGRPFLATAGAKIDVKKGRIDLHIGKNRAQRYDIKGTKKKPTIDGQDYWVKPREALSIEILGEASNGKTSFKGEEKEYKALDELRWKLVDKGGPTIPPDPSQT